MWDTQQAQGHTSSIHRIDITAHGKRAETRIGEVANALKSLLDLSGSGYGGQNPLMTTRQIGSAQRTIYPSVPLRTSWDRLLFTRLAGMIALRPLLLFLALSVIGCNTNKKSPEISVSGTSDKRINELIDALASQHSKPNVDSRERVPMEQAIWDAVDALFAEGVRAFPLLCEHFDDSRFSFSEDFISSGPGMNPVAHRTVGYLCYRIVRDQVQKYESWEGRDPRESPGYFTCVVPFEKAQAMDWLRSSKGKSLWELQIDNLNLVIAENQALSANKDMAPDDKDLCSYAIEKNNELIGILKVNRSHLLTKPIRPYCGR
jgi:hypothetical protein